MTSLLGERIGMAYHGFNSLPGVPGVWVAEFEVDTPDVAAAREAAQKVGPAIRAALARHEGAGLTVGALDEVRLAAPLPSKGSPASRLAVLGLFRVRRVHESGGPVGRVGLEGRDGLAVEVESSR